MEQRLVNQLGDKSLYIEKNEGNIYIGNYVKDAGSAFLDGSFELSDYSPSISPAIFRKEVEQLKQWIEKSTQEKNPNRLALLYGKAGIGKSVVMHDLLTELQTNKDYLVWGLKSDQVEFVSAEDLGRRMYLAQPLEIVVKEMATKYKRVVLLVDQIDALSLSLSSNRAPLRSLLKLIEQIKNIKHVRVIISCRPYDLEYDPLLDRLQIKDKWELKEFAKEDVLRILKENNWDEFISDNLLQFLGNPLHLLLFLKINPHEQQTTPLSVDLLYHQLWRKYIIDDSVRRVEMVRLLTLIDKLVDTMYNRQELSVHLREFETEFSAELKYMFTHELLILTKNGQVQFFHQTLFDYLYARRFTEKGNDLLQMLRTQHQGLFSRAAIKSILSFIREQNPVKYIYILNELLYAKDEDGKDLYRYHIKSLALSNMAYFDVPLNEEINLISRKIFMNKLYMDVIFETVHTVSWFKEIWGIIKSKGAWKQLTVAYKDKVMYMCKRSLHSNAEVVLEEVEQMLDYNDADDCRYIGDLLQSHELKCNSQMSISFYNRLVKSRHPLEYIHLLKNILHDNPSFVCGELKENVRLQLACDGNSINLFRVSINREVKNIYDEMLERHHDCAIEFLIDVLEIIYAATQFKIDGSEIYSSYEFIAFDKSRDFDLGLYFPKSAMNIIIEDFCKNVNDDQTLHFLEDFKKSKHEGFVYIALCIYTSFPDKFKDEAYDIFLNRSVLANAPSWVQYQAIETLKAVFPLLEDARKVILINTILNIKDNDVKGAYSTSNIQKRLKYGHPIFDFDLQKGKVLNTIAYADLKRLYPEAYQERLRIERKYNKQRLENSEPSKTLCHIGWSALTEEQGGKMSCKTWFKSMLKYNSNPVEWDKPSLTGQCELFRSVVCNNPDKFIALINKAIACQDINLSYPLAGMRGLLDANRLDDAEHVLKRILDVISNDINSTIRGFSIHSLLFALSDYIDHGNISDCVIKLLCNTLINAKESDDLDINDSDIYNVGINQVRGNAGYKLVRCARHQQYKDLIFSTIENVAETASVCTRSAILLNLAILNSLDKDRNVKLFKKLMHDYDARLLSMPVHNYNPLVYFINYAVEELVDFFVRALECPKCYKELVKVLWLAWIRNEKDARIKEILDRMCSTNQEARISLLKFLCSSKMGYKEEIIEYILLFMKEEYDSPEMGRECDDVFRYAIYWPVEAQRRVAEAYVHSPLSKYGARVFIEYLAGYAINDPIQAFSWLEQIMNTFIDRDYYFWRQVLDVIIQSYNGIKSFNDSEYQSSLEHAMDLIDSIMQNSENKCLISNFINKIDNA